MRLRQNLQDVQDLVPALGENIEDLWYRHSSFLRTEPTKQNRPLQVKPQTYRERLYRLGKYTEDLPGLAAADSGDDGDADEGGNDDPDEAH